MENPITKFKLCETFPFDAVSQHSKTSTVKPISIHGAGGGQKSFNAMTGAFKAQSGRVIFYFPAFEAKCFISDHYIWYEVLPTQEYRF